MTKRLNVGYFVTAALAQRNNVIAGQSFFLAAFYAAKSGAFF